MGVSLNRGGPTCVSSVVFARRAPLYHSVGRIFGSKHPTPWFYHSATLNPNVCVFFQRTPPKMVFPLLSQDGCQHTSGLPTQPNQHGFPFVSLPPGKKGNNTPVAFVSLQKQKIKNKKQKHEKQNTRNTKKNTRNTKNNNHAPSAHGAPPPKRRLRRPGAHRLGGLHRGRGRGAGAARRGAGDGLGAERVGGRKSFRLFVLFFWECCAGRLRLCGFVVLLFFLFASLMLYRQVRVSFSECLMTWECDRFRGLVAGFCSPKSFAPSKQTT